MRKTKLLALLLVLMQSVKGQQSKWPSTFDELPIKYQGHELSLMDQIRSVTYLFARHFTVKDSIGDIYVSLYFPDDDHQTVQEVTESRVRMLFNVVYYFALEPKLDFVRKVYRELIIDAYDKNGKNLYNKSYPIKKYKPLSPNVFLTTLLERIRLPNTWGISGKTFEIVYYCVDSTERRYFYIPLVQILSTLKLIDKKCTDWQESYSTCANRDYGEIIKIKLPK